MRLESAGASFKDVVKITNFFTDMKHLPTFFEVRDKYVNTKAPPASTAIEISKLARDGALFEIEAIAVLPAKSGESLNAQAGRESQTVAALISDLIVKQPTLRLPVV